MVLKSRLLAFLNQKELIEVWYKALASAIYQDAIDGYLYKFALSLQQIPFSNGRLLARDWYTLHTKHPFLKAALTSYAYILKNLKLVLCHIFKRLLKKAINDYSPDDVIHQ